MELLAMGINQVTKMVGINMPKPTWVYGRKNMFAKKDVHSTTHFLTSLVVPFYRFFTFPY